MQLCTHTYKKAFICLEKNWKYTEETGCLWEVGQEVADEGKRDLVWTFHHISFIV